MNGCNGSSCYSYSFHFSIISCSTTSTPRQWGACQIIRANLHSHRVRMTGANNEQAPDQSKLILKKNMAGLNLDNSVSEFSHLLKAQMSLAH